MKLNLPELVNYHNQQIASRSLAKKLGITAQMLVYALDEGESISQESSSQVKLIEVLEGDLAVELADNTKETLSALDLLTIPAGQKHGLMALTRCKFLQLEL
ncbi:acetate kinase [Ligilactobacillus apodemi]|uniref:Cupin 2 conserved barrel domain-containing protein n=1 Tax=Ligilactobacillus apodemi DSM 16634 = JCM 16172 TaxID=1423724 RepID=A0A0R1U0V7_9LACO|nr:acetate kinase [Ligilactobacillus apodemi]KRL84792.1 hypothetical protein FC32_GL000272 [Ligilactobacillus apodemi DSM 16634 = JCM 16172]